MSTATASPARARKARILAPPVTGQEIVLIGVIALHVAGALKHHFIDRDHTLRRMLPRCGGACPMSKE